MDLSELKSQAAIGDMDDLNRTLRNKLLEIFENDERDVRAYTLNAFFDTLFYITYQSAIDAVPLILEAFEKASEMSRADMWVLIMAASPIIELLGVTVPLWESLRAMAKWWRLE
jgi:hypothetical protein